MRFESLFMLKKKSKAHYYFKISRAKFLLYWPFLTFGFFLMNKECFCFPKSTYWFFFLVKPWQLQQPHEAKLLTSVCLLKGQKCSFFMQAFTWAVCWTGLRFDNTRRLELLKMHNCKGRNPGKFLFIFWEKRWLHKFIPTITDLYKVNKNQGRTVCT